MTVGVIGAGAWGTALAIAATRGGADVVAWSYDGECMHFDDVIMPDNIRVTANMAELRKCGVWLVVVPAAFFRETIRCAREFYNGAPVIICTKGGESASGQFMSEILRAELPECREYGVLSGPQFAAEVARNMPTGSTLAGTCAARAAGHAALGMALCLSDSDDVIGAEICGVGKNAVALICGYATAMYGENQRAMIFTHAWREVVNIGLAIGANIDTFFDLCGIGDLFLSATSTTSRNFSAGMAIANGRPPVGTVEGIYALDALIRRARTHNVDVPVLMEMHKKLKI